MKTRGKNAEHLMNHEELEAIFSKVPIDPRTGFPAGYLHFAHELDLRLRAQPQKRPTLSAREFLEGLRIQAQESLR